MWQTLGSPPLQHACKRGVAVCAPVAEVDTEVMAVAGRLTAATALPVLSLVPQFLVFLRFCLLCPPHCYFARVPKGWVRDDLQVRQNGIQVVGEGTCSADRPRRGAAARFGSGAHGIQLALCRRQWASTDG